MRVEPKLPARDAGMSGLVERSNKYPNSSYLTNWRSTGACVFWDVSVLKAGTFEVILYYTCDALNIGSEMELSTERPGERLVFRLDAVHDVPMLGAALDRIPRAESYVKGFMPYSVGKIRLSTGDTRLLLRVQSIACDEVMNFWLLELKKD